MGRLHRLRGCDKGVTIAEFGLVAPIFLLLLMGTFDLAYTLYARSTLQGALQNAGRGSGLESGYDSLGDIDSYVAAQIRAVVPTARITYHRQNYSDFSSVGKPEDFEDANGNGVYDADECFTDQNGNGQWDSDVGKSGQGGADDVVVYEVKAEYERLFPFWKWVGLSNEAQLSAKTTLRNQPYSTRDARPAEYICP